MNYLRATLIVITTLTLLGACATGSSVRRQLGAPHEVQIQTENLGYPHAEGPWIEARAMRYYRDALGLCWIDFVVDVTTDNLMYTQADCR